jgi:hypothetical protein
MDLGLSQEITNVAIPNTPEQALCAGIEGGLP